MRWQNQDKLFSAPSLNLGRQKWEKGKKEKMEKRKGTSGKITHEYTVAQPGHVLRPKPEWIIGDRSELCNWRGLVLVGVSVKKKH